MGDKYNQVSFASYNILNPCSAVKWKTVEGLTKEAKDIDKFELRAIVKQGGDQWKKHSNWNERKPFIIKNIINIDADVLCLQEVCMENVEELEKELIGYQFCKIVYDQYDTLKNPDARFWIGCVIIWKSDKLELIGKPKIIKNENQVDPRIHLCLSLKLLNSDNSDNLIFTIACVHLSGYNPEDPVDRKRKNAKKGLNGLKNVYDQMEKMGKDYRSNIFVIAGDFNEDETETETDFSRVKFLEEKGYEHDKCMIMTEPSKDRKIDWILFKVLSGKMYNLKSAAFYPVVFQLLLKPCDLHLDESDHLITATCLNIKV